MTRYCVLLIAALGLGSAILPACGISQPHSQAPIPAKAKKEHSSVQNGSLHQSEGERIFQQNCSRCHTAPEGFSPRISGTIVRHMRIRASLSEKEERDLLRFLNP